MQSCFTPKQLHLFLACVYYIWPQDIDKLYFSWCDLIRLALPRAGGNFTVCIIDDRIDAYIFKHYPFRAGPKRIPLLKTFISGDSLESSVNGDLKRKKFGSMKVMRDSKFRIAWRQAFTSFVLVSWQPNKATPSFKSKPIMCS